MLGPLCDKIHFLAKLLILTGGEFMILRLTFFLTLSTIGFEVRAATLEPQSVLPSSITLQIEEIGAVGSSDSSNNYASPVAIDDRLFFVDQRGEIVERTTGGFTSRLEETNAPTGVTFAGNQAILNVAGGNSDEVFVTFTSSTLPDGMTASTLPSDPLYSTNDPLYQIVYKFTLDSSGELISPTPLAAFETVEKGHTGGGMLVLPDGNLILATGDNLGFNRDGLSAPQIDSEHVSKLLIIDAEDGSVTVAAKGVRNVQQISYANESRDIIVFGDIGATTAEEVNTIEVSELTDTSTVENFGWGRNADGNAREGTFYINDGATSAPGTTAVAIGEAPSPEAGFIQPYAQFGRPDGQRFIAISGPIASSTSFDSIDLLFSDLSQGGLFATTAGFDDILNDVFHVNLVDENGDNTSLLALAGGERADPRLFNFADGSAGVLLERTGAFYRLTEIGVVSLPSSMSFLLVGFFGLALHRASRASKTAKSALGF